MIQNPGSPSMFTPNRGFGGSKRTEIGSRGPKNPHGSPDLATPLVNPSTFGTWPVGRCEKASDLQDHFHGCFAVLAAESMAFAPKSPCQSRSEQRGWWGNSAREGLAGHSLLFLSSSAFSSTFIHFPIIRILALSIYFTCSNPQC